MELEARRAKAQFQKAYNRWESTEGRPRSPGKEGWSSFDNAVFLLSVVPWICGTVRGCKHVAVGVYNSLLARFKALKLVAPRFCFCRSTTLYIF